MERTFQRREAYALAGPYSALILGSGTSFVYRDGVVCYVDGGSIRILDVHQAALVEYVVNLREFSNHWWKGSKPFLSVDLLHCQDGVLSFLYRSGQNITEETWLVAIDIRENHPIDKRIRLVTLVPSSKFFVRNDSHFLYVGSYNGMGSFGSREWVLQGYDLSNGQLQPILNLPNLYGSDLRQTLAFEIYDGYLYALSNQSSFEVEEIDWTSYFHCYRFPLHTPTGDHLERRQLFRRQHREGPINDSWTHLDLHKDERTGTLFITECRREWKNGHSSQQRTYYSAPLLFSDQTEDTDSQDVGVSYPAGDPLVKVLDERSRPNWSESVPHLPRNCHPEPIDAPHTFLLAKTKYRTFIPSSLAYLDLVIDDFPPRRGGIQIGPTNSRHWQQQIRIRLGSRIQCRPIDPATGLLYQPTKSDEVPIPDSEERFADREIALWPSANAPVELLDLLNPAHDPSVMTSRTIGDVFAVADERTLVYMPAPTFRSRVGNKSIILVNFDSGIKFQGLTRLESNESSGKGTLVKKEKAEVMKDDVIETGHGMGWVNSVKEQPPSTFREEDQEGTQTAREQGDWWSVEDAKYLEIGKGFELSTKKSVCKQTLRSNSD